MTPKKAQRIGFSDQWAKNYLFQPGRTLVIPHGFDDPVRVLEIDAVMSEISRGIAGPVFWKGMNSSLQDPAYASPLGTRLLMCMRMPFHQIARTFQGHILAPKVVLFLRLVSDAPFKGWGTLPTSSFAPPFTDLVNFNVDALNNWVKVLQQELKQPKAIKAIANHDRMMREKKRGISTHLRRLYKANRPLMAVRLKLYYGPKPHVAPILFNRQISKLQALVKKELGTKIVWRSQRVDYSPYSSVFHDLHCLFEVNKISCATDLAEQIGAIWKRTVTGGDGSFVNCNRDLPHVTPSQQLGLGLIAHDDLQARAAFESAALFSAAISSYARLDIPELSRTYTSSTVKKRSGQVKKKPSAMEQLNTMAKRLSSPDFSRPPFNSDTSINLYNTQI